MALGEALLLVGIPGSGKSTYVAQVKAANPQAVVCSADHWFERPDGYHFDALQLPAAHQACRRDFLAALQVGTPLVIVDNTNLTAAEREPYIRWALAHGYAVRLRVLAVDVATAAARNVHRVPLAALREMAGRCHLAPGEYHVVPVRPRSGPESRHGDSARACFRR